MIASDRNQDEEWPDDCVSGMILATPPVSWIASSTPDGQAARATAQIEPLDNEERRPTAAELRRSVAQARAAMKRLVEAMPIRGLHIKRRRGVPLFRVDPANPAILIRELNGRTARGTWANGKFVAVRVKKALRTK